MYLCRLVLPVNSSHGHLVTVMSSLGQLVTGAFFSHSHLVTSQHCIKLRVGAQNSVGMQVLMVTTNVQNLGATDP